MSTRQILGVAGAVIGAYFGGAQGAQYGWMIGSAVGGAVDPQIIKGPAIGDIAQQTSQEGVPRPIVYGLSPPISGNIIVSSEPKIVRKRESQGKGGPKVETESVYRTYAIGVCEGVRGFVRIWRNGTLVYDVSENSILTTAENAAFFNGSRFFTGTFAQEPSPDLEVIFGVGTTPAHRGTCYMVRVDEDLTDMRGAIPQYMFQMGNATPPAFQLIYLTNDVWHKPSLLDYIEVDALGGGGGGGSGCAGTGSETRPGGTGGGGGGFSSLTILAADLANTEDVTVGAGGGRSTGVEINGDGLNGGNAGSSSFGTHVTGEGGRGGFGGGVTDTFDNGRGGAGNVANGGNGSKGNTSPSTPGGSSTRGGGGGGRGGSRFESGPTGAGNGGTGGTATAAPASGGFAGPGSAGESGNPGSNSTVYGPGGGGGGGATGPPSGSGGGNAGHGSLGGLFGGGGGGGGSRTSFGFSGDGEAGSQGVVIVRQFFQGLATDITLAQIVSDLALRAGVPSELIDVSELEEIPVPGFAVTNTYPCFAALRSLSEIYLFDPSSYDNVLHFVRRGANSVATITEDDMLDDVDDVETERRGDPIQIPRVIHLNYHDILGGLATDKQSSERAGDRRAVGEASMQTAVVLSADDAARAVSINHKIMIEVQRGELKFQLPDSFLELVPSNPIILQWQGKSERVMLSRVDLLDGYQEYTALRDRQSAYTSNLEGIPPAPQTPPPSGLVGPTLLQILDIHILRDADDNIGLSYYAAVSGLLPAWQGALIELSLDGGENYIDGQSTRVSAIMGETVTVLADHPQAFPDTVSTVRVRIDTPLADLVDTDLAGMLNRQNFALIGDELVNFASVDEVSEGVWDLSYFLRGRKGSSTAEHPEATRFVLLERNFIGQIPAGLVDIGRTLTFRATSFGTSPEEGTIVNITYTGRSQIEREVGYLAAVRDGTDAVVSWQGVGRLGGGAQVAHGARFAGYRVTYDDGVNPAIEADTAAQTHTQDVSALGSPITIQVQQLNDLTGPGPAAEVELI